MPSTTPAEPIVFNNFAGGLWSNRSPFIAPGQFPVLLDGENIEVNDKLLPQRRPGFSKYLSIQLGASETPREFFAFRRNDNTLFILADLTDKIAVITPTTKTSKFAPTSGGGAFSFIEVGDVVYFANGTDRKKWDALNDVLSNWGIVAPTAKPSFTISDNARSCGTASGTNWSSPSNVGASDDQYAGYNTTAQDDLKCTNFGHSLPTGVTITEVEAIIEGHGTSATLAQRQIRVGLTKDGSTLVGTRVLNQTLGENADTVLFVAVKGSTSVTKAEAEASTFGFLISDNDTTAAQLNIDHVRMRIGYSPSLSPTRGYAYRYAYKNSQTGHVSTASPVSDCTNSFTSRQVTLTGARSTDAQVDKVVIYRTKDGGGKYFYLTEIANPPSGNWSYTDTTADSALNAAISAALDGLNDPPPAGLDNITFHLGRVWGSVGNKVYYSGGGSILHGVPEEAWSPLNFFTFPSNVKAVVPYTVGVAVFLGSRTYLIRGIETFTFYAMPWLDNLGLASKRAVVVDGDTIYVFTTNKQLLAITGQQIVNVGYAIQDKLNDIDPTIASLTIHAGEVDGAALYLSDGVDSMYRFSLTLQSWSPVATVASGITRVKSVETGSGAFALLTGKASNYIIKRDLTASTDDDVPYASWFDLGSVLLAQPGRLVVVDALVVEHDKIGSDADVKARFNEVSGDFQSLVPVPDPPELLPSSGLTALRFYPQSSQVSWVCRHLQLRVSFPAEDTTGRVSVMTVAVSAKLH